MSQKALSPGGVKSPSDNFQFSTLFHPRPSRKHTVIATYSAVGTSSPATPTPITPTLATPTPPSLSTLGERASNASSPSLEERKRAKSEGSMKEVILSRESKEEVETDERGRSLRRQMSAGGRVKSMIEAIEQGKRVRSNTLPSSLSESDSDHQLHVSMHSQSEGATPAESVVVLNDTVEDENSRGPTTEVALEEAVFNEEESPLAAGHGTGLNVTKMTPISLSRTTDLARPYNQQALGVSMSIEESASYVRVHPLPIGSMEVAVGAEGKMGSLSQRLAAITVQSDGEPGNLEDCDSSRVKRTADNVNGEDDGERSRSSSPEEDCGSDRTPTHVATLYPQSDSMQNLDNLASPQGTAAPSERKKKKKKWRIFKKRRSTEERKAEDETDEGGKFRSHSDAPKQTLRVDIRDQQPRSQSHNTGEEVGGGKRRKQDRYTIFMQDYTIKFEEQKKQSPNHTEGAATTAGGVASEEGCTDLASTNDDLDRGDATPPADMSPLDFKTSRYCHQLKFKLRSALQNIHSSLSSSSSHIEAQGGMGVVKDVRYQLVLLLQKALQYRYWMQQDIETALLSEILRLVEPLPNEL